MAKEISNQKQTRREVPVLVKVISVLGYIVTVFCLIVGIALITGAGAIASFLIDEVPFIATLGAGLFIAIGIVFILLAILGFFVSRGLWKGQNWARITAIVLAALGVVSALPAFPVSIVSLVIDLAILLYLLLSKEVKEAFA